MIINIPLRLLCLFNASFMSTAVAVNFLVLKFDHLNIKSVDAF